MIYKTIIYFNFKEKIFCDLIDNNLVIIYDKFMINTIETRLFLDKPQESEIDSCVRLWSEYYRKTWVLWNNKKLSESEIYHQIMSLNLLTSEQVGSLVNKVKTEHSKIRELSKTQLKQIQSKLDNINKFISKESKTLIKYQKDLLKLKSSKKLDYDKISNLTKTIQKKQLLLNNKNIKVKRLTKSIDIIQKRIDTNTFKLCFGSSALLSQRPGNHKDKFRITDNQKVYKDNEVKLWKSDWDLSRNNIWYSVGDKKKPQGNAEIQYYPNDNKLRLRLTEKESYKRLELISKELNIPFVDLNTKNKYSSIRMKSRFIEINQVEFCAKNKAKIVQALDNSQPISAKIIKKLSPNGKDIGFYLHLSFEESIPVKKDINSVKLTMGIDLNQKGLAYCIVKPDGNKLSNNHSVSIQYKPNGFIKYDLEKKTKEQREWLISNAITDVLAIAKEYGVYNIAIENLDFSSTVNNMNSGYKSNQKYNRMLTQFAKSQFNSMIQRKTERLNIKLYLVNPTFSSIGGFSKYGLINKIKVDIAASLWLARQAIYGKEYKNENNLIFIKKQKEEISFPYFSQNKQSKKLTLVGIEWKDVSLALGKDRKLWYKNTIKFIQLKVGESLSIQNNPFELNQDKTLV